ncbi:MAG: hypothetical protein BHW32_00320 [Firmicutes bacterium CAG:129_59_24]|nr:MAG: hypothetical protein BHW32_00320 [Firmicutes bacterium CAG:129_59_24]
MQSYVMHKPANDPIFTFIEKKRGEGKSGKLAMVAGLNKFLRSDTSYPIGQCCVEIANMDEEVLEPPAFWSVGCLKHKSESFRLRFVLFTTIRSADFPLFPSSPACFFRVLGQNWVRNRGLQFFWHDALNFSCVMEWLMLL